MSRENGDEYNNEKTENWQELERITDWYKTIKENMKHDFQINNKTVENKNKVYSDYSLADYPNKYNNKYLCMNMHLNGIEERDDWNLNHDYNRLLNRIGFRKQDKEIKLFDIKGQEISMVINIRIIPNNRIHYCNENKLGGKKVCIKLNECIELNSKDRYNFSREITKSNIINDTGLYALDNFGGEKMVNDDICNIMYNVKIGSNPI